MVAKIVDGDNRVADHMEHRLTRIESKLETITDAIVSLARMEERMITLFNRMDAYDMRQMRSGERVGKLADRLIEVEKSSVRLNGLERVMYIVGATAISSLFWYFQQ